MRKELISTSKFLSLVLRHKPELIGIALDDKGWIDISELLSACQQSGREISMEELIEVVEQNNKRRFVIRAGRIRANQGHSINIQLDLEAIEPPEYLYHGTATHNWNEILENGIQKMNRQHVHLSPDEETAYGVGVRHGKPLILRVSSRQMATDGFQFYLSENGVWLTEFVPPKYLERLTGAA